MEEKNQLYESLFFQLVTGLQSSAWIMLGKVANPMTGKTEKNIGVAKATIDTLMMLKEKTKGNLSKEEEELLTGSLQQLQVNYVEELEKKEDKVEKKKEKVEEKTEEKKKET